jgi:hypothetical protein
VLWFEFVAQFISKLLPVYNVVVNKLNKVCEGLKLHVTALLQAGVY